jgi:hypothetical protein
MSVYFYQTTWRHFPEDSICHIQRHENLKSRRFKSDFSSIKKYQASLKRLLSRNKYLNLNLYTNYVKFLKEILDSE